MMGSRNYSTHLGHHDEGTI